MKKLLESSLRLFLFLFWLFIPGLALHFVGISNDQLIFIYLFGAWFYVPMLSVLFFDNE